MIAQDPADHSSCDAATRREFLALIHRHLTLRQAESGPALPPIALAFKRELANESSEGSGR